VIHVTGAGAVEDVEIGVLLKRIEDLGGALSCADDGEGHLAYAADVIARAADGEEPVRFRGQVLGFVEQLSEGEPGRLHLDDDGLEFRPAHDPQDARRWSFLGVRAVQSASSSVQISPEDGGVIQFRFTTDSPVRWEALLKEALQRAYARAGRGSIAEFQPRIVIG